MKKKFIIIGALAIMAVLLFVGSCSTISSTQRGIKTTFGRASETVLTPGLHFKIPFAQGIKKYSMAPADCEITFTMGEDSAVTSDMQSVSLTSDVFWYYDETRLYDAATKYTESSLKNAIQKTLLASVKEAVGKYTIYQIVENQDKITNEIAESLKSKMASYPIVISQVTISNWNWSQAFDDQIDETMKATQRVKIAEQELQITEQEAQKQIKEAEAEKEATLIKANAEKETTLIKANAEKEKALIKAQTDLETAKLEAEAKKVAADAEAYYNAKLSENLEVELALRELEVRSEEIAKWDGKYVSTYQYGTIPVTSGSLIGPSN